MGPLEAMFLIVLGVGVLAMGWHVWTNRSPVARYDAALAGFNESRRGVPLETRQAELTLRNRAARLRRIASEAAIRDPGGYHDAVDKAIADETAQLSIVDRPLGEAFAAWTKSADVDEIFYPVAINRIHRRAVATAVNYAESPESSIDDLVAALTVRR